MKIGTLYDLALKSVPEVSASVFTLMYNEALSKISQDLKIDVPTVTLSDDLAETIHEDIVKVISVSVDGNEIQRIMLR